MIRPKLFSINLDLKNRNYITDIIVSQGDQLSNVFRFNLVQDSLPYDLTSLSVKAYFERPDKFTSFITGQLVDAAKGIVDVELTNQILNTPGVATCQVMIIGTENELLSSLKLIFAVEKSINYSSIESTNEYNALVDALSNVQSIRNEFEIVIANATVDSEVILARGGNTTLKERLDNVDAQLAEIVQEQSYVDLFAMGGQSNMQGQSEAAITYKVISNHAYEYKLLTDTLTDVQHPFGEDIGTDLLLRAHLGRGSLNVKFAEAYYRKTRVKPLMVGVAKGATKVEEWLKTGSRPDRYAKMVEKINKAKECAELNGFIIRNKNFVWLQGESDGVSSVTKADYKTRFLQLWSDLKIDCGLEKCYIIRVAKFYAHNVIPIIEAQEELAKENEDIILATRITGTFDPTNEFMQSIWHYTNAGYNLVGNVAGENVGKNMLGEPIILESEPYSELRNRYEFNFRTGEAREKYDVVKLNEVGNPTLYTDFVKIEAGEGYQLEKKINLDTDFTLSLTGKLTTTETGSLIFSEDGNATTAYTSVFYYTGLTNNIWRITYGGISYDIPCTPDMKINKALINHYVMQREGSTLKLYYNNTLIGTTSAPITNVGLGMLFKANFASLQTLGEFKHVLLTKGVITPQLCDPEFYANNEQGTV